MLHIGLDTKQKKKFRIIITTLSGDMLNAKPSDFITTSICTAKVLHVVVATKTKGLKSYSIFFSKELH